MERVNKWQRMKGGGGRKGGGGNARVGVNEGLKAEGEIRSWRRRWKEEGGGGGRGGGKCEGQQSAE